MSFYVQNHNCFVSSSLFTIASAMVINVSKLPWARVQFGPVPLESCGNGSCVNTPAALSFLVLS